MEYEPNQRYAELIIQGVAMEKAKPTPSPGVAATKKDDQQYDQSPQLRRTDAAAFRGLAAGLDYFALDRP